MGDGIQVYLFGVSVELTVILIAVWWLRKLRKDWQEIYNKFDVERFNLRKLNELEVRKQYQINVSNRSATLENLNDSKDINRAWEYIKDNIKTSSLTV
jgi:hypothetical protein